MARFFSNQANKSSNSTLAPPKSTAKRPCVINAEDLFAKNHSAQLRDAIKVLRDASGASSHTGEENLAMPQVPLLTLGKKILRCIVQ
jgi:hypothetical protein